MKKLLKTITKYLEKLLFSSSCLGCGIKGLAICPNCLSSIPLSSITEHKGIYGIYDYGNKIVSESVWRLKYYRNGQGSRALTENAMSTIIEIVADELQTFSEQDLILVPTPQYKKKTNSRGFNQSETIAIWIKDLLPNTKIENILEKTKDTKPQSHLSNKSQRLQNVQGVMRVKDSKINQVSKNTLYIIIDDVTTTGATFLEARRALSQAGAQNILCIALAHGYKRK